MLEEINTQNKLIGKKQTIKAAQEGRVRKVFAACDADPRVLEPVLSLCARQNIPVDQTETMKALGKAAGIAVGASVVALLF